MSDPKWRRLDALRITHDAHSSRQASRELRDYLFREGRSNPHPARHCSGPFPRMVTSSGFGTLHRETQPNATVGPSRRLWSKARQRRLKSFDRNSRQLRPNYLAGRSEAQLISATVQLLSGLPGTPPSFDNLGGKRIWRKPDERVTSSEPPPCTLAKSWPSHQNVKSDRCTVHFTCCD
jgi:hypothetical protein